jgi:hypothetical protein
MLREQPESSFIIVEVVMKPNQAAEPTTGKPRLLELATTVAVQGARHFDAQEHLKADGPKATVKIAFVWDAFAVNLLPKVERGVPAARLRVHRLTRGSADAQIITELSGAHETYLADLQAMLGGQPNGEEGPLLTNGSANIFYIRAHDGSLWAVYAHWFVGRAGWYINAYSVENPGRQNRWNGGRQIVSR